MGSRYNHMFFVGAQLLNDPEYLLIGWAAEGPPNAQSNEISFTRWSRSICPSTSFFCFHSACWSISHHDSYDLARSSPVVVVLKAQAPTEHVLAYLYHQRRILPVPGADRAMFESAYRFDGWEVLIVALIEKQLHWCYKMREQELDIAVTSFALLGWLFYSAQTPSFLGYLFALEHLLAVRFLRLHLSPKAASSLGRSFFAEGGEFVDGLWGLGIL